MLGKEDATPKSCTEITFAVAISGGGVISNYAIRHIVPKQPSQAIVEARKDEVCAITRSAAYICAMRPNNFFAEL